MRWGFSNAWRSTTSGILRCIPITRSCGRTSARLSWKRSGIYRTYLYYCYLLGKLPTTTPNYRPPHPAMREDYRRWAEIEKQLHLLERHSLNTAEDVAAFTSEQEQKLSDLEARRTKCRQPSCAAAATRPSVKALHAEKDELTKQITETRKGAENCPANSFPCQTYAGEYPTVERPGAAARRHQKER